MALHVKCPLASQRVGPPGVSLIMGQRGCGTIEPRHVDSRFTTTSSYFPLFLSLSYITFPFHAITEQIKIF
jgi:hypothetical protein